VEEKTGQRGGPGFGDVDQHGTDALALGCSDNSERHTPHGCGGHGCDRGGRQGSATWARMADRRDRATPGPVGQRLGAGGSERE
jgi:hypothetical protein